MAAIYVSNKLLIKKVLKAGAKLNIKENYYPYYSGHWEFSGAALVLVITFTPDYAVVKSLIKVGANVNALGSTYDVYDFKKC